MSYTHILSRLYNTPLAIEESKLSIISSNITIPLLQGMAIQSLQETDVQKNKSEVLSKGKITVINIFGSLVSKNGAGASGYTSYQSIAAQIETAINNGAHKLIFNIDSPGGEVAGLFSLASYIESLPKTYGIETIGFTDGSATSAAYVLLSACQKTYAVESSILGSIGVIMTLINTVEADKQEGIEYKIIRSKDEKALLNIHESFASKAIEDSVKMLSILDNIMNTTVNSFRPTLSIKEIIDLKGNVVLGKEALDRNLIDGLVSSFDDIFKIGSNSNSTIFIGDTMANALDDLTSTNLQLTEEISSLKASIISEKIKGAEEERTRILGILEAANTFGLTQDVAVKRIVAGTSVAEATSVFEDIKSVLQASNPTPVLTEGFSTLRPEIATIVQPQQGANNIFDSLIQGNAANKNLAN